jgi:trans-2,3-dihydro-3-hydroxyanthranilate isomerase
VDRFSNLGTKHETVLFELYDSFATRRFGGNVAGVVLTEIPLAPAVMQHIAAELGAPTTGFVDIGAGKPIIIRYFTPRQEIGACGHVTVAVATAMVDHGLWQPGDGEVQAATSAGPLPVLLRAAATAAAPPVTLAGLVYRPRAIDEQSVPPREAVEAALGVPTDQGLPIELIWTGLKHLIAPVQSLQALGSLTLSEARVTELARPCAADTICVCTRRGDGRWRMRDLCAPIGALEESASGTTSAALACYLTRRAAVAEVTVEQGVEMGRPSRIEVQVEEQPGGLVATVWGSAVKTASGTVFLS